MCRQKHHSPVKFSPFIVGVLGPTIQLPHRWIQFYAPVLRHTPLILVHVGGTLFLSLLATMVCRDENRGMIGWILLAFSYLQMIVIPWDQENGGWIGEGDWWVIASCSLDSQYGYIHS